MYSEFLVHTSPIRVNHSYGCALLILYVCISDFCKCIVFVLRKVYRCGCMTISRTFVSETNIKVYIILHDRVGNIDSFEVELTNVTQTEHIQLK